MHPHDSRLPGCGKLIGPALPNGASRFIGQARRDVTSSRISTNRQRPPLDGAATTIVLAFLRNSSSRAISPASIVLPRPVSAAMKRFTRGRRSASIW